MEVNIQDVISNVRAVDNDSILSPQVLQKIVNVVMEAVREREEHSMRVRSELKISDGVHDDFDKEWA